MTLVLTILGLNNSLGVSHAPTNKPPLLTELKPVSLIAICPAFDTCMAIPVWVIEPWMKHNIQTSAAAGFNGFGVQAMNWLFLGVAKRPDLPPQQLLSDRTLAIASSL
jgi:hypothetical protein